MILVIPRNLVILVNLVNLMILVHLVILVNLYSDSLESSGSELNLDIVSKSIGKLLHLNFLTVLYLGF